MAFDHGPHRAMLAEMLDAIAAGRAPVNAGITGVPVLRLISAMLESAASARFVEPG